MFFRASCESVPECPPPVFLSLPPTAPLRRLASRLAGCRNVRADGGWWILLRQGFLVARWRGRGSGGACDGRLRRSDGLRRGSSAPDAKRENDGRERQGRLLVRRRK